MLSHLARSRTVFNAVKALNKLGENKHVRIQWIEGHKGHYCNELADKLAKSAATQQVEGPEPFLPLPTCVIVTWSEINTRKVDKKVDRVHHMQADENILLRTKF